MGEIATRPAHAAAMRQPPQGARRREEAPTVRSMGGDPARRAAAERAPQRANPRRARAPYHDAREAVRRVGGAAPEGRKSPAKICISGALLLLDIWDRMSSMTPLFSQSENLLRHKVRAKYIPQPDGSVRLAMVQKFDRPVFIPSGWECCDKDDTKKYHSTTNADGKTDQTDPAANVERATRRAKIAAFDLILCNPDLDTFLTLTYNPDSVDDRASYDDTYRVLKTWLSNRVQRHGLKYVLVPERHKKGGIHWHAIVNAAGLDGMTPARSPYTGRLIKHEGRQIYNLPSWARNGFSTAERVEGGAGDRDAVAKYIFKYMSKQGAKVGGRYFLHGGALLHPVYAYSDDEREFFEAGQERYTKSVALEGTTYTEWSFV